MEAVIKKTSDIDGKYFLRVSVIFFILALMLFFIQHNYEYSTLTFILICFTLAVFSIPFLFIKKIDIFSPIIFWTLMNIQLIARPIILVIQQDIHIRWLPFLSTQDVEYFYQITFILIDISSLFYYIAYFSSFSKLIKIKTKIKEKPWNIKMAYLVIAILVSFSIVAYLFAIKKAGGFIYILQNFYRRGNLFEGLFYFVYFVQLIELATCLLVIIDRNFFKSFKFWFLLLIGTFLNASFGSRSTAVHFWLLILIVYHYRWKMISKKVLVTVGLVVIIFALWFGQFREATSRMDIFNPDIYSITLKKEGEKIDIIKNFFLARRGFDCLAALIYVVPEKLPFQFGKTFLNLFFAPIPRKIWPGKPVIDETGILGRAVLGREQGLPPGNIGVWYMNFFIPGVIIGSLLLGYIHKFFYNILKYNLNSKKAILIYSISLLKLGGISVNNLINWLMLLLPALVVLRLLEKK